MSGWRKSVIGLLAALLLPSLAAAEKAPADPAADVVAAVLASYGGKDAVAAVKTVAASGTIIEMMQDRKGSYVRYMDRSGKLRVEVMPEQGGEVRVLDGNRGWQGDDEHLRPARPMTLQSMRYQYAYLALPMAFTDGTAAVTYGGRQEFRGRLVDVLLVEIKGAQGLRVLVDRENHLIVRVSGEFGMGKGSGLATEYDDYRPVGKVLFPFRLVSYAGDMKLSEISLDSIRTNGDLPKGTFAPKLER